MCGIAGIFGKEEMTKSAIEKMLAEIIHRGPDDQGTLTEQDFSYGMRRLSIIDLSGGHQPIWNEDETVVIVFNGEIYNYLELYEDLVEKGHTFKTKSDTETIVHLYEEYGKKSIPDMLTKLRGMFGFAIYDKTNGNMLIARDYFGIKPIYYHAITQEGTAKKIVAFGSEIKSLLKDPAYTPKVNNEAIQNYLAFQFNPLNETCFKDIFKLDPGSYMVVDTKTQEFTINSYWTYEFKDKITAETAVSATTANTITSIDVSAGTQDNIDSAEDIELFFKTNIKETVKDSVAHHMISDVPVGAFLSGGIDSAITVTLMQQERQRLGLDPVKTFTIGFEEVSEHTAAREVSDTLGTDHHEIKVSFDEYFDELPKIAWHFDEPVADPSAVALYFLAKEARKHVKVVLSGEGADELFGGYNIYREPFALHTVSMLPGFIKTGIIKPLTKLPFNFFGKNYLRRALTDFNHRYIGNAYIFKPDEAKKLWQKDIASNTTDNPTTVASATAAVLPGLVLESKIKGFADLPESRKMQLVDMNYWLPGDILAKADKMTMAHSLELRVPYLDREVAELSMTIPDNLKYKEGNTKYILRKAFESILPQTTANRKKLGFPTPIKHWLKKRPEDVMRLIRINPYIQENFNTGYIETLLTEHLSGKADHARKIYLLLMLALWYNQFIDQTKSTQHAN